MAIVMKASLNKVKCMDMESKIFQMVTITKEIIEIVLKMDTERLNTLMEKFTLDIGLIID